MGRHCKLCSSPNRNEYEKLFLDGWNIKDIWKYSRTKKNENIPYHSFVYHMRNHLEKVIESGVKSSELRKERIRDEIYKTIAISENLRKNIERVQKMIDEEMSKRERKDTKLLLALLQEARQLYKLLMDYSDKIDLGPEVDKETIYDQVIQCMISAQIPDEWIHRFVKEWEKIEES